MEEITTILGPTACGKTAFAAALALETGAEIVSADSRQVYRGMTIGTGKDLDDYTVGGRKIPYHLIDIVDAGCKYNVYEYQRDFHAVYAKLRASGTPVILCGGTGLYIEAVLRGYHLSTVPQNAALRASLEGKSLDELATMLQSLKAQNGSAMHNSTDIDTAQRAIRAIEIETYNIEHRSETRRYPPVPSITLGLYLERETRRQRISERLEARLSNGLIEEVEALLHSGLKASDLMYYGLEYKHVTEHVIGLTSRKEMYTALETAIHQFAKRQMTWFRGMERRGTKIHWIDAALPLSEKLKQAKEIIYEHKHDR